MSDSPADASGVPLFEGWMFGALLYPLAMELVAANPPANDDAAPED